jgi:TBC domain-containing protein kinase-like protein
LLVIDVDVDVFPLSKIYYLWDHYLTGPPLLFMFTAVSILQQLRDQLLASDFTNAMIVFSELSQVSLETCIIDSLRAVKVTPPSILDRLKNFVNEPYDTTKENARFSFLAGKTSIVPHISHADFFIIKPMSVIIDTRPIDLYS